LRLDGQRGHDLLLVDDSGDNTVNTGTLDGNTLTGLDMTGTIRFVLPTDVDLITGGPDEVTIQLGSANDTFYVPRTNAKLESTVNTGTGFDTIYVGTIAGQETQGSLSNINGPITIDGGEIDAADKLFLNDIDLTAGQTYQVINTPDATTYTLFGGTTWRDDTTTVWRSGIAGVNYRRLEQFVLNAGQGDDLILLNATHREQSPTGKNSVFTVNGGSGNDTVSLAELQQNGQYLLDGFAIDIDPQQVAYNSTRGIPIMFNGQSGDDTIHFWDTANTTDTNVAFLSRTFDEVFPAPGTAEWSTAFSELFGADPAYEDDGAGGQIPVSYASVAISEEGSAARGPLNANARNTENVIASLGSGDDVIELFNSSYDYDVTVYGGDGDDTFNVGTDVHNTGHSAVLNGEGGNDTFFAFDDDIDDGVLDVLPGTITGTASITFNGGTHLANSEGDTFRIAGDGLVTGEYRPSTTVAHAGAVDVAGYSFNFTGVEPVIIHGLSDFEVVTADDDDMTADPAATLTIDSLNVEDLNLDKLVLHEVTVDGVVTWSEQTGLEISAALDTRNLGRATAISGDTMVVGGSLDQSNNEGVVYVYVWDATANNWSEQAKLYAIDRGQAGEGFGASVAIDGDTLVVGAPQDSSTGIDSGSVYVFTRTGSSWSLQRKVMAPAPTAGSTFGQAVAISGNQMVVGAAGSATDDAAYVYQRSGTLWQWQATLLPTDNSSTDRANDFGAAVAINGSTIAIGAPAADTTATSSSSSYCGNNVPTGDAATGANVGSVYVYSFNNTAWTYRTNLAASNVQDEEHFGSSVAMSAGRIVVGAPDWNNPVDYARTSGGANQCSDHGRAFIFEGSNASWVRTARLTAAGGLPTVDAENESQLSPGTHFGTSVATSGDLVVVGVPDFNVSQTGAAYAFYRYDDGGSGLGATWTRATGNSGSGRLEAPSPAGSDANDSAPDHFGTSVAVGNGRVVVGIPGFNEIDYDYHTENTGATVKNGDRILIANSFPTLAIRGHVYLYSGPQFQVTNWNNINFGDTNVWSPVAADAIRYNVGATRTYTIGQQTPTFNQTTASAEYLRDPRDAANVNSATTSTFGKVSSYNPATRILAVSNIDNRPTAGINPTVYTYINEGLYWRPLPSIELTGSREFGFALDQDDYSLAIGAPGEDKVYVYTFNPTTETWSQTYTLTGREAGSRFGASVAISGKKLVVGMPSASASYSSANQPLTGYELDLGVDSESDTANADHAIGGVAVFDLDKSSTDPDRLLMPYDSILPDDTSYNRQETRPGCCSISFKVDGSKKDFPIGVYGKSDLKEKNDTVITMQPWTFFAAVDITGLDWGYESHANLSDDVITYNLDYVDKNDMDLLIVGSVVDTTNPYAKLGGNSKTVRPYGDSISGDHNLNFTVGPHTVALAIDADHALFSDWGAHGVYNPGSSEYTTTLDSARRNDIDVIYVASADLATNDIPTARYENELIGSQWGSSVDIVGNTVFVGAPGDGADNATTKSRVAYYDLSNSNYGHWTANIGGYSKSPLRPINGTVTETTGELGADVALTSFMSVLFGVAGDPANDAARYYSNTVQSSTTTGAKGSELGAANTLAMRGAYALLGSLAGNGSVTYSAYASAAAGTVLQPYTYDGNLNATVVDTNMTRFGSGVQLISNNFLIVGTANDEATNASEANLVYNFRQRGPALSSLTAGDVLMPAEVPPAKAGTSVAMGDGIAVVGAPDYDGRGAVFVYAWDETANTWELQSLVQSSDVTSGDRFGSSVSLNGHTLIVGAEDKSSGDGAVYLFEQVGQTWTQAASFAGSTGEHLGASVSVFGATAVGGAPANDAIYVYGFDGANWSVVQTIDVTSASLADGDFGAAVAMDQSTIVVGSPGTTAANSRVAVYDLSGTTWTLTTTLQTSASTAAQFGTSVDVDGDLVVVGDPRDNSSRGAVYVFDRGQSWATPARIAPSTLSANDLFGQSVGIDNNLLVIGSSGRQNDNARGRNEGGGFVYRLTDSAWRVETTSSLHGDATGGDNVGYSVAIHGDQVILGAPQITGRTSTEGSVSRTDGGSYAYIRSVSPPTVVLQPARQEELIAGAMANRVTGTLGTTNTSELIFFDTSDVTLTTGSADDQVTLSNSMTNGTSTTADGGLVAFGLRNFDVNLGDGDDELVVGTALLTPAAVGDFEPLLDTTGLAVGDPLPSDISYVAITGRFQYDGGAGSNEVTANLDDDWQLETNTLTSHLGESLTMSNVPHANLLGGANVNHYDLISWNGTVLADGGGGADSYDVHVAAVNGTNIADSSDTPDSLTLIGSDASETFTVAATTITVGSSSMSYSGIEVLNIGAGDGIDHLIVSDSGAANVN
ncbi:MAG: hypothetical protein KDB23_12765, partial [Planctomycetales bacterium]|nr:hypothetical protein [Planctomycetales bacterium]